MWNLKKKNDTNELTNRNTLTDTENKHGYQVGQDILGVTCLLFSH